MILAWNLMQMLKESMQDDSIKMYFNNQAVVVIYGNHKPGLYSGQSVLILKERTLANAVFHLFNGDEKLSIKLLEARNQGVHFDTPFMIL
jgi:hypothetical protein